MAKVIDRYFLRHPFHGHEEWVTTWDPKIGAAVSRCDRSFLVKGISWGISSRESPVKTTIETMSGAQVRFPGYVPVVDG